MYVAKEMEVAHAVIFSMVNLTYLFWGFRIYAVKIDRVNICKGQLEKEM